MTSSAISLCQASIHDFISSIPSQASEIAVNAVSNFVDDQISDAQKLERNISRVKSAFSRRRFRKCLGEGDGAGDCAIEATTCLLSLPRKVRQNIWELLDDKTVKTMRFVCQQLKYEMDYNVGLSVFLTPESFKNVWLRSISIRCCVIKRLASVFTLNLMSKPEKMEQLYFDSDIFIDPDTVDLVIRKFRNLRQLVIYTEDVEVLRNNQDEAISNGVSSSMIARLEDQFPVTSLDIKFDTNKWKLKWNMKLKPQGNFDKNWEVVDVVGPFGTSGISRVTRENKKTLRVITISIPFVQDHDRMIWLKVLQSQTQLQSLTCDLNATNWKEYEKIVRQNEKSLEKLFLLNITCCSNSSKTYVDSSETDCPFDWKMFNNCEALTEITLIADTFLRASSEKNRRYIENVNLTSLSCPKLRALWLENFKLSQEDVDFLRYNELSISEAEEKKSRFELCTLKNCKIGTEEVAEIHIGIKKERNRSMECLCFGTLSYNDDDLLNNLEKYNMLYADGHFVGLPRRHGRQMDMIDYFQHGSEISSESETIDVKKSIGGMFLDNMNLIGAVTFTAWLAWC